MSTDTDTETSVTTERIVMATKAVYDKYGVAPDSVSLHPEDAQTLAGLNLHLNNYEMMAAGHFRFQFARNVLGVRRWYYDPSVRKGEIRLSLDYRHAFRSQPE